MNIKLNSNQKTALKEQMKLLLFFLDDIENYFNIRKQIIIPKPISSFLKEVNPKTKVYNLIRKNNLTQTSQFLEPNNNNELTPYTKVLNSKRAVNPTCYNQISLENWKVFYRGNNEKNIMRNIVKKKIFSIIKSSFNLVADVPKTYKIIKEDYAFIPRNKENEKNNNTNNLRILYQKPKPKNQMVILNDKRKRLNYEMFNKISNIQSQPINKLKFKIFSIVEYNNNKTNKIELNHTTPNLNSSFKPIMSNSLIKKKIKLCRNSNNNLHLTSNYSKQYFIFKNKRLLNKTKLSTSTSLSEIKPNKRSLTYTKQLPYYFSFINN
jgi:hypothetical protein